MAEFPLASDLNNDSVRRYRVPPARRPPLARQPHSTAQVDMVVVGRAGVFIIDTKAWREVAVHGDRMTRGPEDVTDDIVRFAYSTDPALADTGRAPGEVHAVAALAGQKRMHTRVASIDLIRANDLVGNIAERGARLSVSQRHQLVHRCN